MDANTTPYWKQPHPKLDNGPYFNNGPTVRHYLELHNYKVKTEPQTQKDKWVLICPNGHDWSTYWSNIRNGYYCKTCTDLDMLIRP